MPHEIRESDWRVFRELQEVALDRFCQRVLGELNAVVSDSGRTNHERYLAAYRLLQNRDKELADRFNDLRRSTAMMQIASIQARGLWTEEEFSRFSPELRDHVQSFLGSVRGER